VQFYTLQQASADLAQVIANTMRDQDEAVIVSKSGAVVLLSQEQFASMQEIVCLLSDRCSLRFLVTVYTLVLNMLSLRYFHDFKALAQKFVRKT
jgi:prevent-host-death family protein